MRIGMPQIALLVVSPRRVFEEHAKRDDEPRWVDVLGALSVPTVVAGAAIGFAYADSLLFWHYLGNALLFAASFAIQAFAAAFVGRVVYRRTPRALLLPFSLTLVPHEAFFVAMTGVAMVGLAHRAFAVGLVLAMGCAAWNVFLTYALFRSLGSRVRAALSTLLHFTTIAALVALYMRAQDLLPYPPGRP